MDQLRQQVARARRRLVLEQFLGRLVWCWLVALSLAAVALAVPRVIALSTLPAAWDTLWVVGALAVGFLAACLWTYLTARSPLDAAIEIDRRFQLRERVASSLSLSPQDQQSEAGRALVHDAVRAISRVDVGEQFRVRLDRRAFWPLVPAAIALVLVMFVDYREAASNIDPTVAAQKQVQQSAESLRKKIEQQRQEALARDLKMAEQLFKQIELATRELSETKDIDRTQAHVKLNDLAQQLEERRQQLGGKEGLREQFKNLKNLAPGPAEKAARAIQQGDWKQALEEINKLAQQVRESKLDAAAKEQLAKQLQQMQQQLDSAAHAHQQAMEGLKQQIEKLRQQGDLAQAGQLQQKLDQLTQQQQHMDRLQQLAQQLGQCQQCLQQGDAQKAADAMAQLAQQLAEAQQQTNELELLDAAMNQLEMAKQAMGCFACQGKGCQACQGKLASMGLEENTTSGQPGTGIGVGRGAGPRADEPESTKFRDTQVRQKPGQGSAVFSGTVEGPNIKGDLQQAINQEMASLGAEPADPLTTERLPKSRRDHAREYFELLRKGR
jgi:chemotaxis protein histidine kinase CheA